jgi:uncharacterized membrane protein
MKPIVTHLQTRPRLYISAVIGLIVGLAVPGIDSPVTRALLGWNVSVWLFLALIGTMMLQADSERVRRRAIAHAEGALVVLVIVICAALVSLGAIVFELSAAKSPGARHALPHILFALATVGGSWLLVPTLFAMNYASLFHITAKGSGLHFPDADVHKGFAPDYIDFLYFSFTIAVASQTADVSICSRSMRRLVLLQALLSFVFNTTILAFTINIAASLF